MTILLSGCKSEMPVAGVVLVDEQPLTCSGTESCRIAFHEMTSETDPPEPINASVDPSGSFSIPDLPVGKYRVVVSCYKRYPFDDKFARHFRKKPDAITVDVTPKSLVEVRIPSEWVKRKNAL